MTWHRIDTCASKQPKYRSLDGEATECRLYVVVCIWLYTSGIKIDPLADQKQEINFVWPYVIFNAILKKTNGMFRSLQRIESLVGVALSGDTAESVRDDILLCRLMNKLHPGIIHTIHEEV